MEESTALNNILEDLEREVRALRLTDTQWAARAGIRKETLSRLRGRRSCDFGTLDALARVVGSRIGVIAGNAIKTTRDGRFPAIYDRDFEARLIDLCASRDLDAAVWERLGPKFFMAGLAVMLASVPEFDRRSMLELAERLHAGSSQADVFALWLKGSPLRPSRFLPMLRASSRHAA
jgi:hypothetical protein